MPIDPAPATSTFTRPHVVAAGCTIALALCVGSGWLPFGSLRLFILESWPALLIALAGIGLGGAALFSIGLGRAAPRWQIVLGGGLGLGLLALLVLGLGCAGHLSRNLWFGIVAALATIGAAQVIRIVMVLQHASDAPHSRDEITAWLWVFAMPALAMGIFAASFPPGILWATEGNGYDVLEYHFGAPREYFDAGRISFLPHNIYSNFPFNVEMLYLLTFVLRGGPQEGAFAAQFLNVMLAAWAVAAAWLAGRTISASAGHVAGVLVATCPWLAWLCGIAYVEPGMLMFIGLGFATVIEAARRDSSSAKPARWMAVAGLAIGLACGCKYTAIPMVAAPLLLAVIAIGVSRRSWIMPIVFIAGTSLSFAPWTIKNYIFTGSPIFPLARSVFPERSDVWNEDGAARWHEGHLPDPDKRSVRGRLGTLRSEIVDKHRFDFVIYAAGIAALAWPAIWLVRRKSTDATATTMPYLLALFCSLTSLGVWLGATHLQDRFLIPILIPGALLVVAALNAPRGNLRRIATFVAAVALSAGGLRKTWRAFDDQVDPASGRKTLGPYSIARHAVGESGGFEPDLLSEAMRAGEWAGTEYLRILIDVTERGGKVLMVGDARAFYLDHQVDYCVVFNRNPLDSAARRYRPKRVLEWLKNRGYTHVYVDWGEMKRLRNSRYGFWKSIDEEFFGKLVRAGLRPVHNIPSPPTDAPARATLFKIPDEIETGPAYFF